MEQQLRAGAEGGGRKGGGGGGGGGAAGVVINHRLGSGSKQGTAY